VTSLDNGADHNATRSLHSEQPSRLAEAAGSIGTIGTAEPPLISSQPRNARTWVSPATEKIAGSCRFLLRQFNRVRKSRVLLASSAVLLLAVGYTLYCIVTLPFDGGYSVETTPSALVVEANDGHAFATRGVFKGEKLSAGDVPPDLARAVIAIEDRRFYEHDGIDLRAILRASWRNLASNRIEGASTITQQLVRMMYLSPERTLKRKVQEAMLAIWLEIQLSKQEILARYLNTAYFGGGVHGIDAAAKRYFGKSAHKLSLGEAAMLAGLIRAPSALAPHRNLERARERAAVVLAAMVDGGAISQEQADAAVRQPAALRVPPETPVGTNYFVDMINGEVRRLVGAGAADLRLTTTIDLKLQALAESVVAKRLAAEGKARKVSQAALIALAPDGAILAMVGGKDYNDSQFNRAIQARRQPGSLFKLFVYLAAFEKGFTAQSTMIDRPVQIGEWEPENFGGRYRGQVTLRQAFASSLNTIAVQLTEAVGIPSVIGVARKLGIQSDLPAVSSLALGSAEVSLLDMTRAFAAIAADAESIEPYGVRTIRRGDQMLYARPAFAPATPKNSAARAAMHDLLASVVREGTGKAARMSVPAAGKTGTTQEHRDAWFVGFTPDIVVGVWVGNDDNSPTNGVTGGGLPATIWRDFVTQAGPTRAKTAATGSPFWKPATAAARGSSPRQHQPEIASAVPETVGRAPRNPAELSAAAVRGAVRVLDTGTLAIDGKVIRLFGVDGLRGRAARALARLLDDEDVECEAAGTTGVHRCRLGDLDLSEQILLSGAGRASEDASPDLVATEQKARDSRAGLWRRR
jgi:1A family penicillin-binding protein